jgi:hypothetical protein
MSDDITHILNQWPFDPEKAVRRIVGEDGRAKLQVRLPLGIEQYELAGRPDGKQPHGDESYLQYYERRLAEHLAVGGAAGDFVLTEEDCSRLREESMLYYFRYLLCFQLGEYGLVIRDTERNMEAFRLVGDYAEREEDRVALAQYWPYIIRMNAMAQALKLSQEEDVPGAVDALNAATERIRGLTDVETQTFELEKMRSLGVLEETVKELGEKAPPSESDIIRRRLQEAVESENYERAAQLRDLLRSMGG